MRIKIKLHKEKMDLVAVKTKLETMNLTKLFNKKTRCQSHNSSLPESTRRK